MSADCSGLNLTGRAALSVLVLGLLLVVGCGPTDIPDQSQFKPIEDLESQDDPVVRIYGAPLPILGYLAYHSWIILKHEGPGIFDRWEVETTKTEPYGNLWKNARPPAEGAYPNPFVLTEIIGHDALFIIDFIEAGSPHYPFRDVYVFWPGPNCNTYTNWVVENTGWDYELPEQCVGKDYPVSWPPEDQEPPTK